MFLSKVCFLILNVSVCVRCIQGGDVSVDRKNQNETILNDTSLRVNDAMEKVFLMKNGTVVKSAFVPFVQGENDSDEGQLLPEEKSLDVKEEAKDLMMNNTQDVVIKNGKKYRIVKLKKNARNFTTLPVKGEAQRRSFDLLPKLSSLIPVKWMTKGQTRSDNDTEWSIFTSSKNRKKSPSQNLKQINSEKIQKLLNLFTIVKFDNGECYADGIKGTCLHQTECEGKGGKFTMTCAGELGVCCYFERTCGEVSKENCSYFVNEGFPKSSTEAPKVCTLTVEKSHPNIKQLRLDFLIFQLKEPVNGTCIHDRLVISGQDISDTIPDICGANTGQHIYINMEDSNGPFNLNIITVGEYFPRNFRIKVTQLVQGDLLLAPNNCLQYYAEPTGYLQTFNYQHNVNPNIDEIYNGYFNNLNYVICIKKLKGFCSISYENEEQESVHPSFQLTNVDEGGERLLPPMQAGAETFDCPDDYIIVNGVRLCGEKLNDATVELDYMRNYPVTDISNGPFILSVKTDGAVSGRGFYLKYTQHPCVV